MDTIQSFEEFLATSRANIPLVSFIANLTISALLGMLLSVIYVKFGTSLSNRRIFARNFVLMTMTTMLIISIVKSSLALSLGLVGALSIIRFRAAIKEPEELTYLFLTIAIGLGFGANQGFITLSAFIIIFMFIIIRKNLSRKFDEHKNFYLTISTGKPETISIDSIVDVLKSNCKELNLKRFDSSNEILEASFLVDFESFDQLNHATKKLKKIQDSLKITFLDNQGIGI